MAVRIFWNRVRGTITSAIWNAIDRPCRMIFAPIFSSRSRSVAIDQCVIQKVDAAQHPDENDRHVHRRHGTLQAVVSDQVVGGLLMPLKADGWGGSRSAHWIGDSGHGRLGRSAARQPGSRAARQPGSLPSSLPASCHHGDDRLDHPLDTVSSDTR